MELVMTILTVTGGVLAIVLDILLFGLIFAAPFLMIYAIYRAIKGLMTHDAELKNKRDD